MRIFFSVGEPSGDLHGANLICRLKTIDPCLEAVGYGGPKMAAAGCRLHDDLTQLAVMWLLRVLLNLHRFTRLVIRADRFFRHHRPDAVVLIDYPGFNWWIARRARVHGIPVFYYTPPQIWAWASWRVRKMRRLVDHVLCSLPFEASWFKRHGCNATYVGHPYFDEVREQRLDEQFLERESNKKGPTVAILPGSRTQEVLHNLHWLLKAAESARRRVPDVRFTLACFKSSQAALARRIARESAPSLPLEIHVGRTPELIQAADCSMAVSGSVSLELLYHAKPTVILYWITPAAFRVQRWFRKVKYITLVNLLSRDELYEDDLTPFDPSQPDADSVPFPEYMTSEDRSEQIAEHVCRWLTDPNEYGRRVALLESLRSRVAHGGASQRAAEYILAELHEADRRRGPPRPHFRPGRTKQLKAAA
jgi:lipid-A-disaccharide synthase